MARHIATPETTSTTSRRSLMKGVAWATPVAVMSIAAPAVAASQPPPIDVTLDGDSCKYPGQSTGNAFSYKLIFNIENNRDYEIEWRVTSLYVDPNSGSNITFPYTFPTEWTSLSANGTTSATFISNESTNSANGDAVFTFEVRKVGGGEEQPVSGSISVGGLPPCKDAASPKAAAQTEEDAALVEKDEQEAEPLEVPTETNDETTRAEAEESALEEEPVDEPTSEEEAPSETSASGHEEPAASDGGGAADSWAVEEKD